MVVAIPAMFINWTRKSKTKAGIKMKIWYFFTAEETRFDPSKIKDWNEIFVCGTLNQKEEQEKWIQWLCKHWVEQPIEIVKKV